LVVKPFLCGHVILLLLRIIYYSTDGFLVYHSNAKKIDEKLDYDEERRKDGNNDAS
jgi:hypothetical protein